MNQDAPEKQAEYYQSLMDEEAFKPPETSEVTPEALALEAVIEHALELAANIPTWDEEFLLSLQEYYEDHGRLTEGQVRALNNVVETLEKITNERDW